MGWIWFVFCKRSATKQPDGFIHEITCKGKSVPRNALNYKQKS